MHFALVDAILERGPDRIVAIKHVSMAEEYLQDHFASFPVLPGVFMLEVMVQAARALVEHEGGPPLVLGVVRALRYGNFARPGSTLRVEVTRIGGGEFELKGQASIIAADGTCAADAPTAASGKFSLRPIRP